MDMVGYKQVITLNFFYTIVNFHMEKLFLTDVCIWSATAALLPMILFLKTTTQGKVEQFLNSAKEMCHWRTVHLEIILDYMGDQFISLTAPF